MSGQVTQTIFATPELNAAGVYGNCIQAAVASLTGRPMEAVPHFGAFADWRAAIALWADGEGYAFESLPLSSRPVDEHPVLLVGPSPRGYSHVVVGLADGSIWDPHPSRDGLLKVAEVLRVRPHHPARCPGGAERRGRVVSTFDHQVTDALVDGRITEHDAEEVRRFASFLEATTGVPSRGSDRDPEQARTFTKAYRDHYPEDYALAVAEAASTSTTSDVEER